MGCHRLLRPVMLVNLIFASELPPTSLEHSKLVRERDLPSVLQGSSLFQERFVLLPERENQIPVLYQLTIKNKVLYLIKFNITLINPPFFFKTFLIFCIHMMCLLLFPIQISKIILLLDFKKNYCYFLYLLLITNIYPTCIPFS